MIGISWKNGAVEIWDHGVIVTVNGKPSATLTDREQVEIIHHALEDWLREHPAQPRRTVTPS